MSGSLAPIPGAAGVRKGQAANSRWSTVHLVAVRCKPCQPLEGPGAETPCKSCAGGLNCIAFRRILKALIFLISACRPGGSASCRRPMEAISCFQDTGTTLSRCPNRRQVRFCPPSTPAGPPAGVSCFWRRPDRGGRCSAATIAVRSAPKPPWRGGPQLSTSILYVAVLLAQVHSVVARS